MCYSLEASVIAGLGLGVAGVGMVTKALRSDRGMLLFAAFPLFFSLHQFTEAAVWATLDDPQYAQFFRGSYTLIAFCLWPVLTPLAAAYEETDSERRKLWQAMAGVGVVLALWLIAQLYSTPGVDVRVIRHSLAYEPAFDRPPLVVHGAYLLLTVLPLVACSRRNVAVLGWIVLGTFVYALAANRPAWYSLWCLAAAALSFVLALAIQEPRRSRLDSSPAQS